VSFSIVNLFFCTASQSPPAQLHHSEKNGETREFPMASWLLDDLQRFAERRGARWAGGAVFHYRTGAPLTHRRFNTIFDRGNRSWRFT
jgi:hypothetical protein